VTVTIAGGAGGSTFTTRKVTLLNGSSVACRVNIVALGDQTDVDAIVVTLSSQIASNDCVTLTNVASTVKLHSITVSYDTNFSSGTAFLIKYPEPFGNTSYLDMPFPTLTMFLATGTVNSTSAYTVSISGGVANTAYIHRVAIV
jgi:hypothetical protein